MTSRASDHRKALAIMAGALAGGFPVAVAFVTASLTANGPPRLVEVGMAIVMVGLVTFYASIPFLTGSSCSAYQSGCVWSAWNVETQ